MSATARPAPLVSVVMPAFNAEPFLHSAIESLLAQTLSDFELIMIDDGSTDKTKSIASRFRDPRVHILSQPNRGIVASLNRGFGAARGTFIARMDADDTSHPDRLQKQVDYLQAHPEVGVVGSFAQAISATDELGAVMTTMWTPSDVHRRLFLGNALVHGSVMLRRSLFAKGGGYEGSEYTAEDYGLWLRLLPHCQIANLPTVLYAYRENAQGISQQNATKQNRLATQLKQHAWESLTLPRYGAVKTITAYFTVRRLNAFKQVVRRQYVSDQRELVKLQWRFGHRVAAFSNALGLCLINPPSLAHLLKVLLQSSHE